MQGVDALPHLENSLKKLHFEIWHGFIFVNISGNAPALRPQLRSLEELASPYCFEEMKCLDFQNFDCDWNWKTSLDNFSEAMHQPLVHPEANPLVPSVNAQYFETDGPYSYFFLPTRNGEVSPGSMPTIAGLGDAAQRRLVVLNIYPTFHLLIDRNSMFWLDFDIRSVEHHQMNWRFLAPATTFKRPTFAAELDELRPLMLEIMNQDVRICRKVRDGIHSRLAEPGRLSLMERVMHQFHNFILDSLGH